MIFAYRCIYPVVDSDLHLHISRRFPNAFMSRSIGRFMLCVTYIERGWLQSGMSWVWACVYVCGEDGMETELNLKLIKNQCDCYHFLVLVLKSKHQATKNANNLEPIGVCVCVRLQYRSINISNNNFNGHPARIIDLNPIIINRRTLSIFVWEKFQLGLRSYVAIIIHKHLKHCVYIVERAYICVLSCLESSNRHWMLLSTKWIDYPFTCEHKHIYEHRTCMQAGRQMSRPIHLIDIDEKREKRRKQAKTSEKKHNVHKMPVDTMKSNDDDNNKCEWACEIERHTYWERWRKSGS